MDRILKPLERNAGWSRMLGAGALCVVLAVAASASAGGQTHKVTKSADVLRSVGVYEWTGDMAKPTSSRLIPVSLFIDGKLQDAAVYLASPVPLALLSGNLYQLERSGVVVGELDLAFARHLVAPESATTSYDDGWFGYGRFVAPAPAKPTTLKASATIAKINGLDDLDSDEPHFSERSAIPGSGGAATGVGSTDAASAGTPPDDPDRPTLHRSASGSEQAGTTSDPAASPVGPQSSGSAPADDPDRPTLRRRTPEQANAAKVESERSSVTGPANTLNDDPNRPVLHRGKPTGELTDADLPKLLGLPGDQDLHQMVAVSDAADHPPHDFSRSWADESEHQAILAKMQATARAQLAAYEAANGIATAQPPAASAAKPASRTRHAAAKAKPAAPETLLDETLTGYTLSYGGAATFVYHAHTDGLGSGRRFVTLVAQVNMNGEPEIALKNVTDAGHLDRTPRMRLVDVVDAEASNRASLLFELRAQNSRQFALYRVIGARAEQTFLTGSTQ
ncbi:MAG TPA: hypothetical protein VGU23_05380 [Acidobacteriaceae bacterium]|nr:hypothetical protein [Acidobacteriaceae bacterium]